MEKVPPGEAVLDQGEAPEWVGLAEEGWVVRGRVQVLRENASVQHVERLLLMTSEHPVPL
jgi:CRP-like cAMP-binding protein